MVLGHSLDYLRICICRRQFWGVNGRSRGLIDHLISTGIMYATVPATLEPAKNVSSADCEPSMIKPISAKKV